MLTKILDVRLPPTVAHVIGFVLQNLPALLFIVVLLVEMGGSRRLTAIPNVRFLDRLAGQPAAELGRIESFVGIKQVDAICLCVYPWKSERLFRHPAS